MGGLNYDSKDLKDTHVQVLGMGQKWDAGDILLYKFNVFLGVSILIHSLMLMCVLTISFPVVMASCCGFAVIVSSRSDREQYLDLIERLSTRSSTSPVWPVVPFNWTDFGPNCVPPIISQVINASIWS